MSKTFKDKKTKYLTAKETTTTHLRTKCVERDCDYCFAIPKVNRKTRERLAIEFELSSYNLLVASDALKEIMLGLENPLTTTTTKEAN